MKKGHSMSLLHLVTDNLLKTIQNIPCKNIIVSNGRILLEETVPLFLPGETITVSCNKGFGMQINQSVFRQEFTTTCSTSSIPLVCSTITKDAGLPRAQNSLSVVQIDSSSSKSCVTVGLLVFLACLSSFLRSPWERRSITVSHSQGACLRIVSLIYLLFGLL